MFVSHLAPRGAAYAERDLSDLELWQRSLDRSLRRRELAERHRRQAPKTKGTAAVLGATLFASPLLPAVAAAGQGSGKGAAITEAEGPLPRALPTLLREGDTGRLVAAAQAKLGVEADGIFGPITRGAVLAFQNRSGLSSTGEINAATWRMLFRASVSHVPADSSAAVRIERTLSPQASSALVSAARVREVERSTGTGRASRVAVEPAARRAEPEAPARKAEPEAPAAAEPEIAAEAPVAEEPAAAPEPEAPSVDAPEATVEPEAPVVEKPVATVKVKAPAVQKPAVEKPAVAPAPPAAAGACGSMASPVSGTRTSGYGENRGTHSHAGVDIAAPTGTPVRAADCGTVTKAASEDGYGNIVCVQHSGNVSTCYAHLSSFDTSAGEYVEVGQIIGKVGSTGRSTGPHLHFEVRENGRAVNPDTYLARGGSSARQATADPVQRVSASASAEEVTRADGERTTGRLSRKAIKVGSATEPLARAAEMESTKATSTSAGAAAAAPAPAPAPAVETPASAAPASPAPAPAPAVEAPAPAVEAPAPAPAVETPAPVVEATAPVAEAPAPAPAVQAPAPVVEATAPVAEAPAPAPAVEAPAPVVEAPAPAPAVEAPAPPVEAPAPEAPAPAPAPAVETPAPAAEASAAEAPAPAAEAPAPAPEAPAPEAPAPAPEAPAPEAPAPAPEAPAAEAPAPAPEAPAAEAPAPAA